MPNRSKVQDPRFWEKWKRQGAVKPGGTLVTKRELKRRCKKEGIGFAKVCCIAPRWAESGPLLDGVKSALVRPDLIIRADGTFVCLDGAMGMDSISIAQKHSRNMIDQKSTNFNWEEYVEALD